MLVGGWANRRVVIFPCWVCPINNNSSNDVAHVLHQHIMGVKERIQKVLMTKSSCRVRLIQLVALLRDKIDDDIFDIFETMCEVQECFMASLKDQLK